MNRSGVAVRQECVAAFNEIKQKHQWKYVIFKLTDDKRFIKVAKKVQTSTYEDFVDIFREDECFFALYDFEYQTKDRGADSKIVFFSWTPEDSQKERTIYASSRIIFKDKMSPHLPSVEATEREDLEPENVAERIHQTKIIRHI